MGRTIVLYIQDSIEAFAAAFSAYLALGDSVAVTPVPQESFRFEGVMVCFPRVPPTRAGSVQSFGSAAEAWTYFHPQGRLPPIYRCLHAASNHAPGAEAFVAWLTTQPRDLTHWHKLYELGEALVVEAVEQGSAMLQYQRSQHDRLLEQSRTVLVQGQQGLMLCVGALDDDMLGRKLADKASSFALLWRPLPSGEVYCKVYVGRTGCQPFKGMPGSKVDNGSVALQLSLPPACLPELLLGNLQMVFGQI